MGGIHGRLPRPAGERARLAHRPRTRGAVRFTGVQRGAPRLAGRANRVGPGCDRRDTGRNVFARPGKGESKKHPDRRHEQSQADRIGCPHLRRRPRRQTPFQPGPDEGGVGHGQSDDRSTDRRALCFSAARRARGRGQFNPCLLTAAAEWRPGRVAPRGLGRPVPRGGRGRQHEELPQRRLPYPRPPGRHGLARVRRTSSW